MDILGKILQEQTPIYDRYLNGDFQVGADNLNPKRELDQLGIQNIDQLRLALYIKYKDQIAAATNGDGGGSAASPQDVGLPYVNRTQVSAPVAISDGMAPTDTPIPIEQSLYRMLKVIDAFLGGEPVTLSDLPFDICNDRGGGAGGGAGISGTGSSITAGGAANTSGLTGAGSTGSTFLPSSGSATAANDTKCVMVELQMLQAIFGIITFIKRLLAIEQAALAYIYPFIEFIQMVIACILNPAMRQQLIMAVVGQVLALIITFLTNTVAQWLGSLNLDCLMSNVMSVVQQALGSINGVGDLGSAVGSLVSFNANAVAGAEAGVGMVWQATKGNSTELYEALGIPSKDQTQASSMNAGQLFDLVANSNQIASIKSTVGMAKGVYGSAVGAVVAPVQGAINGVSTSANNIAGSAKLIKDYFPGGKFSTF